VIKHKHKITKVAFAALCALELVNTPIPVVRGHTHHTPILGLSKGYPSTNLPPTYLLGIYLARFGHNRPHKLDQFLITMSIDQQN
jgi:hypothetical protein